MVLQTPPNTHNYADYKGYRLCRHVLLNQQYIGQGVFSYKELRGWELPSRAKHFAEAGDIYFGAIWGSAVKWCIIPSNVEKIVVTNGCFRCRIRKGKESYLPDLLAYMNSEGWAVQMRSISRGSDGLAEICEEDASQVIIPTLSSKMRESLDPTIKALQKGSTSLNALVNSLIKEKMVEYIEPTRRPSHIVLV